MLSYSSYRCSFRFRAVYIAINMLYLYYLAIAICIYSYTDITMYVEPYKCSYIRSYACASSYPRVELTAAIVVDLWLLSKGSL